MSELVRALALVMVIEGLLPFISPGGWRTAMASVAQLSGRGLRVVGLASMLAGLLVLSLVSP